MLSDILSVGNKIEMFELSKMASVSDEQRPVYVSQILEFDEDDEEIIKIAMPISEGKLIPLQTGRRLKLCFYTKNGLYTANCVIEKRYRIDNIYMMDVRFTTQLKKFQRRQFYRLNCNIELGYKVLTEEEYDCNTPDRLTDTLMSGNYNNAISLDISGGGVRFAAKNPIEVGSGILLEISFNTAEGVRVSNFLGRVISSVKTKNNEAYEIRVNFENISERDREFIIKFIFNEERKKRQKESGLE